MRYLVDANLPRSTVAALVRLGHRADHVNDIGLKDATDAQIAERARASRATIVTRDLDFGDVRRYPPTDYKGIIVLRLADDVVAHEIVRILERFMEHAEIVKQLPGRLAVVEAHRFRLRPALTQER